VAAAITLSGCGSSTSSTADTGGSPDPSASAGFDSVSVSGDVGTDATVKFAKAITGASDATKVLTEGNGEKVAAGDSLIIQTVIADATTQKTVASSYQDKQPQVVSLSSQVQKVFLDALQDKNVGSRVAVLAPGEEIFGPTGNASLGISQKDAVVIVFDIIGKPVDQPDGTQHSAPSWAPKVQKSKGVVSGLDFAKTPRPDGKLRSANLYDGSGPVVKKGQTIFARYLGQVYDGKKPFDQNFDGAAPATFQIGTGGVIAGWDKTLVGQHVGSEVLLAIPPKDGYGKAGKSDAGIKGTDTLYFVVDIVGAA
jgi:peptidylprolyl isomerase